MQQRLGALQGGIAQSIVGGGGINTILSAMEQVGPTGGPAQLGFGASIAKATKDTFSSHFFQGMKESWQMAAGTVGLGPGIGGASNLPTDSVANKAALDSMAASFNNVLGAGQQVAKQMGVALPDAFGLTQQAMLQVGNAFNKNGTLTDAAKQQIANLQTGYAAMNTTTGTFGKNVGAVNVQLGLQHTQVATVNTAWDQFTNNAVQGAVGASSLAQNLALAHPQIKATAQALSGFGPSSAAAWATFASTSTTTPGLLQQAQSQADWVRIAQTSGALSGAQGAGMTAYLAQQLLPYGAKSPLAASAIGILGQQAGMPSGLDQKQQTAWLKTHSETQAQYNRQLQQSGVIMASVSGQAAHFGQTVQSNVVNAMAQGAVNLPKMSADMSKLTGSLSVKGVDTGALKTVLGDLKSVGVNAQSASAILSNAFSSKGVNTAGMTAAMNQVKTALAGIPAGKQVKVSATANTGEVDKLKSAIATLQSKTVQAAAKAQGQAAVAALQAEIAALKDKLVTVQTNVITNYITTGVTAPGFHPTLTTPGALHAQLGGTGPGDWQRGPHAVPAGAGGSGHPQAPGGADRADPESSSCPRVPGRGDRPGPGGLSFSSGGSLAAEFAAGLKQRAAEIARQTASQIATT